MEPITMITLIVTFVGALAIGYAKFYERKISSGETWSDQKFGMFFLVALALMVMTYFLTGGTAFPEEETLNAVYMLIEPIAALFGLTVATITGGRILKQKVVAPVVAQPTVVATPVAPVEQTYKKMTDSTKQWLTFDATPENKSKILEQIASAEEKQLYTYQIVFDGGFYNITGGILSGAAGNPAGKY